MRIPCLALLSLAAFAATAAAQDEPLIPDLDATRKERIGVLKGRFVAPEGFEVQEVAGNDLVGSVVNLTFDAKGRPTIAREGKGIAILVDADHDGKAEAIKEFSTQIKTAHGMCFIGPGDLLVHADGPPEGAGLYRLRDKDGDDVAEELTLIQKANGGIGEHGPHTILVGADGELYIMFGNHSHPDVPLDPASPLRESHEDQILPAYNDPRGHAVGIKAPGGTIHRVNLETNKWVQVSGGYRNAFDMAMNYEGEIFNYDSDMEWDVGLPWFRSTRVIHCTMGVDFGWRTGSGWLPFYAIDALPPIDAPGRGSPVGVAFYEHYAYPERFRGAFFHADWSRGRIRVLFPREKGATYEGKCLDFILGEPLNVTDLDIGARGSLYFSTGGRGTTGGVYRVKYAGPAPKAPKTETEIEKVLRQPMPRSAWGNAALAAAKEKLGAEWDSGLAAAARDRKLPARERLAAIEALQRFGPKPDAALLSELAEDKDATVRGFAVFLLGAQPLDVSGKALAARLKDKSEKVQRRACEALVRAGISPEMDAKQQEALAADLIELLDSSDRFLSFSARITLARLGADHWRDAALKTNFKRSPRGALEGLVALAHTQTAPEAFEAIFARLREIDPRIKDNELMLDYLRAVQIAMIRDPAPSSAARADFAGEVGPKLLKRLPAKDWRVNRELQATLAAMKTPGAIPALLAELEKAETQQEQIHTVYCLRTIENGWEKPERDRLIAWFDRGREYGGGASFQGYIEFLWQDSLKLLPAEERAAAEKHKEQMLAERAARAAALMAQIEGDRPPGRSDLAQMSFQELSEYLEYDVMTYERGNAARGEKVFRRAKCADCHVFGTIGTGGGPDLSTVVKRFRRKEILESIMYPSKVISDQYQAFNVDLKNGDVINGLFAGEDEKTLTLINATGARVEIAKADIAGKRPSTVSLMPEGLLETMNLGELVDLILFLERGAGEN